MGKKPDRTKMLPPKKKKVDRFLVAAQTFVETSFAPATRGEYSFSMSVDIILSGNNDPSKRVIKVTFSRPTPARPVAEFVAGVFVDVVFKDRAYKVTGYRVEGKRQVFEPSVEFNAAWIERVIEEKRKMARFFNVTDGFEDILGTVPETNYVASSNPLTDNPHAYE